MIKIFSTLILWILFFTATFCKGQVLDSKKTIEYINSKYDKGVQLDSIGNITIAKEVKFNYKDVTLSSRNSLRYVEFQCKYPSQQGCVEKTTVTPVKMVFSYKVYIENNDLYSRLYNAFDNLMKTLQKERPELNDSDPFAPHNYNKK